MKRVKNKRGLTLVEILFSLGIIAIVGAAILQFYLSSINLSEMNKEETIAMAHLTNMMEAIKSTPASNIILDFPDGVPDGQAANEYAAIVGGYILKDEHIVVSYTDPNSNPLEINVGLSWLDRRGVKRERYLVTKRKR